MSLKSKYGFVLFFRHSHTDPLHSTNDLELTQMDFRKPNIFQSLLD